MDYDTMVDIYYDATPPYEGPWFDEWGTELDKWGDPLRDGESEEEDDEEDDLDAAGNIHQTENGAPSSEQVNELGSDAVKAKVAVVDGVLPDGPEVIVVSGAVVSTVQVQLAGLASTFPATSRARTSKV